MTDDPHAKRDRRKLARREARLCRAIEKSEVNARTVARWNGRLCLYAMTPIMLAGLTSPGIGPQDFMLGLMAGCFNLVFSSWVIRWGKRPPRTADEYLADNERLRQRLDHWFRGQRSP